MSTTSTIATVLAKGVLGLAVGSATVLGATGTASADTPPGAAFPSDISVVTTSFEVVPDDAIHDVTDVDVTCTAFGAGDYTWELTGDVVGAPIDVAFTTSAFHGAGSYHATGITDDHGGLVTVVIGTDAVGTQAASNGDDTGTFTIDEGELSTGTIDAVTHTADGHIVRVLGTWGCTHR